MRGEVPDTGFRHLSGFLDATEVDGVLGAVRRRPELLRRIDGRAGLGPRYHVLDGELIREQVPEVLRCCLDRVLPAISEFAGEPLAPLPSPRRAMRVQIYSRADDGFRWHRDGHSFTALLTLRNASGGETQMLSPGLSRVLTPLLYALYPVPQIFSPLPRRTIVAQAGDLLLMRGRELIHRGVTRLAGERVVAVFAFERPDYRPHPLHDAIARRLNF
jgi:hypothetical protein